MTTTNRHATHKRALVTGGAGLIGSHLVDLLLWLVGDATEVRATVQAARSGGIGAGAGRLTGAPDS